MIVIYIIVIVVMGWLLMDPQGWLGWLTVIGTLVVSSLLWYAIALLHMYRNKKEAEAFEQRPAKPQRFGVIKPTKGGFVYIMDGRRVRSCGDVWDLLDWCTENEYNVVNVDELEGQ